MAKTRNRKQKQVVIEIMKRHKMKHYVHLNKELCSCKKHKCPAIYRAWRQFEMIKNHFKIASFNTNRNYAVDLNMNTCSCEDYTQRYKQKDYIGCKHILKAKNLRMNYSV